MNDVLTYFREQIDPGFKSVPDNLLTEYIYQRHPEFLKDPGFRRDIKLQFGREQAAAETAAESAATGLDLSQEQLGRGAAGIASGLGQFSKLATRLSPLSLAPFLSEATGVGEQLRSYGAVGEQLQAPSSLKDIAQSYRERGALDALREAGALAAGSIVEQAPQLTGMALTGGALNAVGVPAKAATYLAPLISVAPQEAGGAYQEIGERTGQQGVGAAGGALGVGILNAALERFGVGGIVGDALDPARRAVSRSLLGAAARSAGQGILGEGVTEGLQETATALTPELYGATRDPNLAGRIAEAAAVGAVTGGAFSGPIGAYQYRSDMADLRSAMDAENAYRTALAERIGQASVDFGEQARGARLAPAGQMLTAAEIARAVPPSGAVFQQDLTQVAPQESLDDTREQLRIATALLQRRMPQAEAPLIGTAQPRAIAESAPQQFGLSPEIADRLRQLRQQEEAAAAQPQPTIPQQQQLSLIPDETAVQVPEARQPVVQEGGQGTQGVGRVDRPTEVRQGAVPADVAGGAQVAAAAPASQKDVTKPLKLFVDGVEGQTVPFSQVPNGNPAFEYALGTVEQGGVPAVYRRKISESGTYGGWRWETDAGKISSPTAAAPQVAPATTLLYGDSTEIAPDDTVEISGKAFGPEVSKVLHKARIRGAATRNQDGSISIRVTDAGISEKRGRSADAPVPRVQQAGFALNDTITFRSLPSGLVRVERRNAQGQESAPAVEIRPTKGLFSKVERVVQEAPAVDAQTSTILQSIFGAVEDPRFARFSELFDKVIFKKATEEEATEFEALDKSLTPTESTLLRAAYYRQVGPQQMRLMMADRLTQAGLVVDEAEIDNAWDKAVTKWVAKRMTPKGAKTDFALRKAQGYIVTDLIRKAQKRGPVASSTVPEDAETSPIPEPASGMGPAAAPTARTTDIGEASASQASAEEALFNADVFSFLAETVGTLERRRRGQRITDDELVQILTGVLRQYNPEGLDALQALDAQLYDKLIGGIQEKVKAIYKQGGSRLLAELADAYETGNTEVISLLSRPWSAPTGLSVAGVQSHLALRYGIRPDSGMVGVISIPGADFNGRLLTLRSTGQPIGIQINAATVSSLAEVDKVLQHELAEMALAQGVARDVLSQISAAELAEIRSTVAELGYDPSNDTEVDARIVEQLVAAYRNRNWFQRVVANVLAWANSKGLKITRLAAELIAARAVASSESAIVSGVREYNLEATRFHEILNGNIANIAKARDVLARQARAKKRKQPKGQVTEAVDEENELNLKNGWLLPDGTFIDTDPAPAFYQMEAGQSLRAGSHADSAIKWMEQNNPEWLAAFEGKLELENPDWDVTADGPFPISDADVEAYMFQRGWVRVADGGTVQYIQGRPSPTQLRILKNNAVINSKRVELDRGPDRMSFTIFDPSEIESRESRTTFTKREKVADELGQPGLLPDQQDIIESSAAAQAGVVPASIKATITAAGLSPRSRTALSWLGKVFDLSASPKPLSSLNPDDTNTMQIASAVMGQVDRVRKNRSDLILKLEKLREQMLSPRRAQILSELATANAAANAAGAASSGLTKDFRAYNRQEILTYAGTDASLKNAVTRASDAIRLLYTESKEINKAFEVMAENVPDAVIAQAKTLGSNQPIFDYVINSKMLDGKVSKSVIDALTVAPAAGKLAPLQSYRGLASALRTIKDYTADVSKAKADRKAFEALFAATSPSTTAKAKRVDIEDYARRYRALRNAEQDAVDRIRSLSREIEALDNALLDTIEQIGVLDSVMGSAEYTDSANTASNLLNLFAPEILGVPDPNGVRHVVGGTPYVIPSKFDPETDRDAAGRVLSLSNAVNARLSQIASGTEPVDPVERRTLEHLRLKLQQFAGNTAGNAALRIGPFNPARLRRKIPILRSLISRRHLARIIPGRLSGELNMLNAAGDSLEKALDGQARRDKTVGINALNVATSRALASHPGMDPLVWKAEVLNEILNANQKDTDFRVTAGMTTPFGHTVTKEDIDAAKLQARFSHKVYSVSTAKDRGGVLRFFPNMIMEGNRLRLPFVTGAMTTPRRLVRDEVEGGPVYYAKQIEQALENPDEASRKAEIERILNEPNAFTLMARRYVWETNSEFKNRSPYAKIYRKLAVDWWTNKTAAPTNLDELVDQIAAFVPGTANTQQEVRDSLINEIVAVSKASLESQRTSIQEAGEYVKNGVGDEGFSAEVFSPSAVVSVVDSFNQFTKPRGDMVAPGSFYDYTLATDESQNALIVAAMMPLRIRQLRALMDLQRELMKHKTNLAQRMNLNPQSVKQDLKNGKLYLELSEVSELLQVLSDALETFKGRVSAPNIAVDNGLLRAWNAVHKALLVNALTAATGNILFGIAGGDTAARVMTRGYTPRTGISTLAAGPRVLLNIVERAFANNPDAVRFIKKNRSKLGALGARMMRQAELYAEIEAAARRGGWRVDEETAAERAAQVAEVGGFRSPIRSRGELRDSLLNRIERKLSKRAIVRVKEALFRFQPAGDEVANDLNAKTALTNLTLLFQAGYNIIKNRAASGVPNWDNWTDPNNFIRPEEAKQVAGWSPEILFWLKENMAPAGSLEYLLHDYYKRVEAAKAAGTDPEAVAPLADEDALADVMIRILSASNLPADSSRADLIRSSSGMGQALSFFWGFPGWINNWLDSLEGFSSISSERRSQLERLAMPVIYTMALTALLALSGLWPNELLALFYELVNGRPYNVMTAREFASAPTPAALGKLMAVSLARMVPYAGEYIAGYVGATQNKPSMTDLSKMSIPLGVLANFSNALETAWKTGDIAGAALGLTRSTLPILNPIVNRIAPQGRDAINDAVRVATRNAGDLEIKTRPGGGGGFEPTEFSSLIKRAVAANANGDAAGAKALLQRAADVKAKSGVADPWSAVKSSLKSQAPDFKTFGRTISDGERAGLLGRMSANQRDVYQTAENAVSSLLSGIGTKAEREAASGGGGGLVAAQRQIRAITGTPKPIKAIRKQLRAAMPKGLKLKRSRGTRLGGTKLRLPKGTSVASLSSSRLLRQGPRPTVALGRAYREQRRRGAAGLPLGPMTYGGMPSVARGY